MEPTRRRTVDEILQERRQRALLVTCYRSAWADAKAAGASDEDAGTHAWDRRMELKAELSAVVAQ